MHDGLLLFFPRGKSITIFRKQSVLFNEGLIAYNVLFCLKLSIFKNL